jgi:hypothetical protein
LSPVEMLAASAVGMVTVDISAFLVFA